MKIAGFALDFMFISTKYILAKSCCSQWQGKDIVIPKAEMLLANK